MKKIVFFVFFIVLSSFALGAEPNEGNINASSVKKGDGFEVGRYFQGVDVNNSKKTKRPIDDILQEMLEVQKKQLDTQEKILAILENEFDPKPKKIIVDGKECIENSSADCFNMPILSDAGKKVPVLKNFVQNPTVETAKEWLRWYAKFVKVAGRGGQSIELAINKYGTDAYPVNYSRYEFDTAGAYSSVLKDRNNKLVLSALSSEVELYFFLGKNADGDAYSIDNYAKFVKEIPNIKYHIVFYNEGSKKAFMALASRLKNIQVFKDKASSTAVDLGMFKTYNIYATPLVGLYLKQKKQMRNILLGRSNVDDIINKAINTLEYDDILKDGHSAGYKQWERASDYSKQHYKNKYDVDLNSEYLEQQYKEGQ